MRTVPIELRLLATSIAALLVVSSAMAEEPGSRQTREYVQASTQSDQFEILEARTALTASTNPEVRSFASQMLQDHSQSSRTLSDAAMRSGLKAPVPSLSEDQSHLLSALQGLAGINFDKAYITQQALAHRSALVVAQIYAATGDDANVKRVAASSVQLVQDHLMIADQLAPQVSGD